MQNRLPGIISFFEDKNSVIYPYIQPYKNGSMSLYIFGIEGTVSDTLPLYVRQNNAGILFPDGDSSNSGIWLNSDGTTTNLFSYVNDNAYDTIDNDYIVSFQSGQVVQPRNLYWVADSGIYKYNLSGSGVTKILDGNNDTLQSTHLCYNEIDDYIYYGVEAGETLYTRRVDKDGARNRNISNSLGAGLSFYHRYNTILSIDKDGEFRSLADELAPGTMSVLTGRETLNRRTRIDENRGYLYALQTESTSYLTKIYRYNFGNTNWEYLRTLTYGLFGGAFDIDFDNNNIYYTATPDFFSPSYYGIVKENIASGTGTRIIAPSGTTYFQTKELRYNNYRDELYYVAQDVSNPQIVYSLIKTDASGNNPSTLFVCPEHSGMKAMEFDGTLYKSSIDFNLSDLPDSVGLSSLSDGQISSAFVSVRGQNLNDYSYIRARVLTQNKQDIIWSVDNTSGGAFISASGKYTQEIGNIFSSINALKNTANDWNSSILRIDVAASPSGNLDVSRIYSANVNVQSAPTTPTQLDSNITLYTQGSVAMTGFMPLVTISDAAVKSVDLYIGAASGSTSNVTLYTYGNAPASSYIPLYTAGVAPSSVISLYSIGHIQTSGLIPLYISGSDTLTNNMCLFLKGNEVSFASGNIPLFTYSTSNSGLRSNIPLFINSDTSGNYSDSMVLYVGGEGGIYKSANIPLYIHSVTPSVVNSIPLFVSNNYSSISSGMTLYVEAPSGTLGSNLIDSSIPLYISRSSESIQKGIPLYLHVNTQYSNYIPLFMSGTYQSSNYIPCYMSGIGNSSKSINLYTHGF